MGTAVKKNNLFGRRYEFDEENLFSHSHDKSMEGPTFPWWKPVQKAGCWQFQNKDGELFNPSPITDGYQLFPDFVDKFFEAAFYEASPVFFVDWAQKLTYYKSTVLYRETETKLYAEAGDLSDMKPKELSALHKAVEKACEKTVLEYFKGLM